MKRKIIIFVGFFLLFFGLLLPKKAEAAFSAVTARGSNTESATGDTNLTVNPSANLTVGKIVFIQAISDNAQTTDGASTLHTITDTDNHTWIKVYEETETDGAANDGSTTSLWWTKVINQISTTDTITLTLGSSRDDKIISVFEATVANGNTLASVTGYTGDTQSASGTSLSHTLSSLTSREYLWVGSFGAEGEDTAKTPDATGGATYTELFDTTSATAGAADVNVQGHVQYRIATATGDTVDSTAVTFTSGDQSLTAFYEVADPTAALTGTVTASIVENDIVAGGKTIILTLTNATWVASGATFDAERQNIINGLDSAQSEANGWDAVVKAGLAVTTVVRTSNTVVTVTLSAFASYNITATETITATIPTSALDKAVGMVASPTFTVAPSMTVSGTVLSSSGGTETVCAGSSELRLRAGSSTYTASCTDSTGAYSFTGVGIQSSGAGLVVWIEGLSTDGALAIRYDGSGDSTNNTLYESTVSVTSDDTNPVDIIDMNTFDNGDDGDIPYTATDAATDTLSVSANFNLRVNLKSGVANGSAVFLPVGTVTLSAGSGDLHIDDNALATLDTNSNTVADDILVDGGATLRINSSTSVDGGNSTADITTSGTSAVVTTTSGTPTLTVTSDGGTIGGGTTPTLTFYNLTTSGSSSTTISNTTTVNNDISVGSGTTLQNNASLTVTGDIAVTGKLTVAATLDVNGGDLTTSGAGVGSVSINYSNTPTVTIASASEAHALGGGTGTITFYNLTMNGAAQTTTLSTNNLVIDNALSVGTSHTFAMQTNSITIGSTSISDSGDITMANGAASSQSSSGTVTILGNSNAADWTGTGTGTFTAYNLTIGNGSATMTVDNETGDLSIDVNNTFTNTANATFQASTTGSFTVGHNWSNSTSAVFTANQGAVIFDGISGNKTITSGGDSFYDLYIDNGGTSITWELQDALDVNRNLSIDTSNTLDAKSGSNFQVNVAGNWTNNGTYTSRDNNTIFDGGTDTTQIIDGSTTFYSVFISGGDRIIQFGAGDTFTVPNSGSPDFQIEGDNCVAPLLFRSTLKGTQYTLTIGAAAEEVYGNIDFQDANFTNSIDVSGSGNVNSGNNTNITNTSTSCISASTDSSAIASGYSFQRKTFFDSENSRYWTFNHDGDEIEIRYSSNGTTWNNPATAVSGHLAYDTNDFSVWWSSISTTEYVWLAVASSNDILIRRGTLSSTDITWDSDVITAFNGSGASDTYSYPYFSLDSSNYMWVGARYYNGTNYVYKAVRSDASDTGDATWDTSIGFGTTVVAAQLSDDQTNANVFGNIVPLASQDMYATFVVDTAIEGCKWVHSSLAWKDSGGSNTCSVSSGGSGESTYFDTLDDSFVGYWKMNESSWNGTSNEVVDSSSNTLHGVRVGNATTTGAGFQRSGTFDGSGDYVSVGDNTPLDITGDFTLSAWVARAGGTNGYIISKTDASSDGGYALLHGGSGEVYCRTVNGSGFNDSFSTTGFVNSDNVWHHVVAVRSGTSCRVYIDGIDRTNTTATHTTLTANNKILAMGSAPGGSAQFNGKIDDVRIYSVALTGEQIVKLYQLVPERVNIADTEDFGSSTFASGRHTARTKSGVLYSFFNDAGSCELWKSTDGVYWSEVDSSNNPTCVTLNPVALAIDSSDTPHIAYAVQNGGNIEIWWNSVGGDTFDTAGEIATAETYIGIEEIDLAIDSNNIPHVFYNGIDGGDASFNLYNNRIGGGWNTTSVSIEATVSTNLSLAIDEDNVPTVAYINTSAGDLSVSVGQDNDPDAGGQWATPYDVDTDVSLSGNVGASLAVDTLTGDIWIGYVREDTSTDDITLAKRSDGSEFSSLSTGWTIDITNSDVGNAPSIAIAESSDIYVLYENDTDDIAYSIYNGSSWSAEVTLHTGTFQDARSKWSFEWNNYGANKIDYTFSDGTDIYWDYLYIRRSPTNIDNASDFESPKETGQVVRTSTGVLYSALNDGGICEIWRSADNGNSWSEQDSANHKTCVTGNPVVIEIDSSNNIHMVYHITGEDINYVVFNTTTNTFGTAETALSGNSVDGLDLALDSSDKPHIITMHTTVADDTSLYYLNKTTGSWSGVTSIETATGGTNTFASFSIVVNDEDIPEVAYSDDTNLDLKAVLGNQNNATSFSSHTVDASLSITGMTIGVDASGNTWISYVDDDGYITLAKHPDGSAWTSGWTTDITDSKVISSNTHSMSIDGANVYLFYEDDQDDIVYDKYDGSSWSGETLLEEHEALSSPIVRWSYFNNYDSTGVAPIQTNTYIFDNSDSCASGASCQDPQGVWTNDANLFDGESVANNATSPTAGSASTNYLRGDGTNAPASGGTITSVKARVKGSYVVGSTTVNAAILSGAENLGAPSVTAASGTWSSYTTLSAPTGGWTWSAVQALSTRVYVTSASGTGLAWGVEVLVQSTNSASQNEFDYLYSDSTDVFYNRLLAGVSTPGTQDSIATTTNGTAYSISAVSDASSPNDVHLLYLDNSATAKVLYKRWDNNGASSAWQSAATVEDTGSTTYKYVSLTLDTSSKDLWAAFVDQTSDDDIYYVRCDVESTTDECDASAEWDTNPTSESTATGAVYNSLTTNYNSTGNVFGIWTNTSATPFAVTWSSINAAASNAAPSSPTTLYTNESETTAQSGVANPVGVGDSTPAFSAVYADSDTGDIANKYEVIVYSDAGCTSQVWDSGSNGTSMTNCTQGNRCADIEFAGTDLPFDGTKYYWKIKYWDDEPAAGSFSDCSDNFTILSPAEQLRHGNYFFNQSTERKYTW